MKRFRLLPIAVVIALSALGQTQSDPWAPLRPFVGKWEGATSGKPGNGTTAREYRFELNDQFLFQRDKSVYQPKDPGEKPLAHEDFGVFSYDKAMNKILWRQFHSEGFVNEYALDSVGEDGKTLEFVTTHIENLPGFRAKKQYRIVSANEIEETFWLAPPGKELAVYTVAHLKRAQ